MFKFILLLSLSNIIFASKLPISEFIQMDLETINKIKSISLYGIQNRLNFSNFSRVGDSISANGNLFLGEKAYSDWGPIILKNRAIEFKHNFTKRVCTSRANGDGVKRGLQNGCSAFSGKTTAWLITKNQAGYSPVDQEFMEYRPAYSIVMIGTNDISIPYFNETISPEIISLKFKQYQNEFRLLVQNILAQGSIPILSTIPPRTGDYTKTGVTFTAYKYKQLITMINDWLIEFARVEHLPLMDFFKALCYNDHPYQQITSCRMYPDGIHPSLDGYGVRNELTITALKNVIDSI